MLGSGWDNLKHCYPFLKLAEETWSSVCPKGWLCVLVGWENVSFSLPEVKRGGMLPVCVASSCWECI